jgi:TonB-linked SusC/RagA family outer membrane protein
MDFAISQINNKWHFIPEYNPEGNRYCWQAFLHPGVILEDGGTAKNHTDRITFNAKGELSIIEGLKFVGQYGYIVSYGETKRGRATFISYDWYNNIERTDNLPNEVVYDSGYTRYNSFTGYLEYNKSISKHNINLMVGSSHEENDFEQKNLSGRNLLSNDLFTLNLSDKTDIKYLTANSWESDWALTSFFGRVGYNYNMKYLIDFTLRTDGSSKFAPEKRWSAVFPAVSTAWNIGNEEFMRSLNFFNQLKLRLSWGQSGNQNLSFGNYDYIPLISINTSAYPFGEPGVYSTGATSNFASASRTWETIAISNVALDFSMLRSRLSGSFELYKKINNNMLVYQDLPALLGGSAPTQNLGKLETKGFDLVLGWKDKVGDFRYGVSLILSDSQNKVLEVKGSNPALGRGLRQVQEGYPLWSYFGFKYDGIIKTQEQLDEFKKLLDVPATIGLGDVMYRDMNGDGRLFSGVNDDGTTDVVYIGCRTPRYTYSSNIDLGYKNVELNIFLQGVGKRHHIVDGDYRMPFNYWWYPPLQYFYGKTWTPDRPDATHPRIIEGGRGWDTQANWNYMYSDAPHRLINAAYMRVKLITVGYRVPQNICNSMKLKGIRVYASGQDMFTFAKETWGNSFDPEEGWQRSDDQTFPFSKTISFGIDINF